MFRKVNISKKFSLDDQIVVYPGDCLDLMKSIPDGALQLIVTSPPYNIGKEYEKKLNLHNYLDQQAAVIKECVRVLPDKGSICWQVGLIIIFQAGALCQIHLRRHS